MYGSNTHDKTNFPDISLTFQDISSKCIMKKIFFLFLNQTFVVGTQKNHLNETVQLSTPKYVKTDG